MTPFALTKFIGTIAASILVYFAPIIGANYPYALLTHLEDVVNGTNTTTSVSVNAPNWGYSTPLATPQISTVATSTGGTLTNGVKFTVRVAALDGFGTTTLSDATSVTTSGASQSVLVKWAAVPGATGYVLFFGTTTAPKYNVYKVATTTGQFLLTATSSMLSGSDTFNTSHAFSTMVQPYGPSYLNGSQTSATSSVVASTTGFQVGGTIVPRTSATTTACEADTAGSIFYNEANSHAWGCAAGAWTKIF